MKDGAHQKHGLKPNPDPESKLQRTLPVADAKTHDKVSDHEGDDKILGKLTDELPSRRPHIGNGGRVHGAHFEICLAEQKRTVPKRSQHKRYNRRHDDGPEVYFVHRLGSLRCKQNPRD